MSRIDLLFLSTVLIVGCSSRDDEDQAKLRDEISLQASQIADLRKQQQVVLDDLRTLRDQFRSVQDELKQLRSSPAAATQPASAPQVRISIRSEPSGAKVLAAGVLLGETPITLVRPAGGDIDLRFEKDGFRPHETKLKAQTADVVVQLQRQ